MTNPLDVARTRLQLLEASNVQEQRTLQQGYLHLLRKIAVEEGLRGWYKGLKPRLYIKIPGSAITFLGYEWLKEWSLIAAPPPIE